MYHPRGTALPTSVMMALSSSDDDLQIARPDSFGGTVMIVLGLSLQAVRVGLSPPQD
jgi:hypothetical protein